MAKPSSLTISSKTADLVSAALRHVRDAEHLLDAGTDHTSLDQAYYLAGFGLYCARKAPLSIRWLDLSISHGFDAVAEALIDFAVSIDPIAHRYDPFGYAVRYPMLAGWNANVRYDRTGRRSRTEAEVLCREARSADTVVIALWISRRQPRARLAAAIDTPPGHGDALALRPLRNRIPLRLLGEQRSVIGHADMADRHRRISARIDLVRHGRRYHAASPTAPSLRGVGAAGNQPWPW